MIYWIFKRYMKRLVKEYKESFEAQAKMTQNVMMRPDFYWLEKFLDDEMEWEQKGDSIVRKAKR